MTVIRNVTGTAFVVAEFRAEENRKPHPLCRDPIVHLFLDEESRAAAERVCASFSPIKTNVWIRTRYLDDRLDRQLQLDYRQIVILGAGLDTRAARKPAPGVAYFEIDDEAILAFKKAKLEENRIDANVAFIPGDYVRDPFMNLLKKHGFDCELATYFIWEGNTMYLTAAAVGQVLTHIARNVKRFSISFDYMAEEVIAKTTGDPEITSVVERFAAMGASWTYGINDLQGLAVKTSATILETFKIADLHRIYWPNKPLDSPMYDYYSICTLQAVEP